jgi:UPF0042 nucleotide-binding protein
VVDLVVIAGMSGAGRTQVGKTLEDLGWFVIDNLPSELIPKVAELARFQEDTAPLALVVGTGADAASVATELDRLRASGAVIRTVFLDASTPTLVRRYGESKRRHPLLAVSDSVDGAVEQERLLLGEVRGSADVVIDTTDLNVHDLRTRVHELFAGDDGDGSTQVTVTSFGFKHGVPPDADLVLDCRFLPNPYWVEELRPLSGRDAEIQEYVNSFPVTEEFVVKVRELLDLLLPAYLDEGKAVLTVAFGCTGGRHRSVAIAEEFATWLQERGVPTRIRHRDVER